MLMILEPLYYVSYATLVWGDLGFINFVDNTRLSQNQMARLQWGRINDQSINLTKNMKYNQYNLVKHIINTHIFFLNIKLLK